MTVAAKNGRSTTPAFRFPYAIDHRPPFIVGHASLRQMEPEARPGPFKIFPRSLQSLPQSDTGPRVARGRHTRKLDFKGVGAMKKSSVAVLLVFASLALPAAAAEPNKDIKGLYLLTDYPAVSVRPGTTSTVSLRLQNYGLPPERYALTIDGTPPGWTATLLGGGQPIAAAMPATDQSVGLQLRLDVPANADLTTQTLTVKAEGQGSNVSLP